MVHYARFGHSRALADFLESRGNAPDDLKAKDILNDDGHCWASEWKLDNEKREKLNKQLMHLSVQRASTYTGSNKPWDHSIFEDLRVPTIEYMEWVCENRKDLLARKGHAGLWSDMLEQLRRNIVPFRISGFREVDEWKLKVIQSGAM